ncbi:hypothetical protein [Acetobacter senegalensis]
MCQIYDLADGMVRYVMHGRSRGNERAACKPCAKFLLSFFRRGYAGAQHRFQAVNGVLDKLYRFFSGVVSPAATQAVDRVPDDSGRKVKSPVIICWKRLLYLLKKKSGFLQVKQELRFARRLAFAICHKMGQLPQKFIWGKSSDAHKESSFHVYCNPMMDVAGGGSNATACASQFPKTDGAAA